MHCRIRIQLHRGVDTVTDSRDRERLFFVLRYREKDELRDESLGMVSVRTFLDGTAVRIQTPIYDVPAKLRPERA